MLDRLFSLGRLLMSRDNTAHQEHTLDLMADEQREDIELMQPYGFAYRAKKGAEAFTAWLNGEREHGVTIMVADRRYRMKRLEEGEVAIYDDLQQCIYLTRKGILVKSDMPMIVDTPETVFKGNVRLEKGLSATGDIETAGDCIAAGISQINHTHNESIGSETDKPK